MVVDRPLEEAAGASSLKKEELEEEEGHSFLVVVTVEVEDHSLVVVAEVAIQYYDLLVGEEEEVTPWLKDQESVVVMLKVAEVEEEVQKHLEELVEVVSLNSKAVVVEVSCLMVDQVVLVVEEVQLLEDQVVVDY